MESNSRSSPLRCEMQGRVALLTLARVPANALDETMLAKLAETIVRLDEDPGVGAVLISSALPGVFCAGGDLTYWPRHYASRPEAVSAAGRRAFERIERLNKPTVAAVHGAVIGDGLSLLLACDLRLAAPEAVFRLPEVTYGFIPGWGTLGRLAAVVGPAVAAELLLTGEPMRGARALEVGLVQRVFPAGDLTSAARALATHLAAKPPRAMRWAKTALRTLAAAPTAAQREAEELCFAAVWGGAEWRQGVERAIHRPPTPPAPA